VGIVVELAKAGRRGRLVVVAGLFAVSSVGSPLAD
jgi:hypothetical protein